MERYMYADNDRMVMVKTTIELPEDIDKRFRQAVAIKIGLRKGALSKALQEAIEDWIKQQEAIKKKN